MRKRIWAAFLAIVLCAAALPRQAAAADILEEYSDLDRSAWYAQGVRYCLAHGLMNGYGKRVRIFAAEQTVTRAQLVTILWRMEGAPELGLSMQYADVPDGAWYAEAVRWATSAGVMSGYTYVAFGPDDPVTREQLAMALWHYAQYLNGYVSSFDVQRLESYRDCAEVDEYALDAMLWADGMGIMTGVRAKDGGEDLLPDAVATRSATATILMRFCLDMGLGGEPGVDEETGE